jgi:chitodextrinase
MERMKRYFHPDIMPQRLYVVLFALVFAGLGTYYLSSSHAAGVGTLTLSPASGPVSLGATVTVTINENSSTTAVNAVEADLTYDQTKLQYVSTNTSTSPFTLVAANSGGSGSVTIASATSTPVSGTQVVAIVTFTAIGTGSTNVAFSPASGIAESTNNTNILGTSTGATYTISDTTAPSVPIGLVGSNQTATSLKISWNASTDNVAVTGYKVFRNGTQVGTSATTSYTDTGLTPSTSYSYTVSANDAAGNNSAKSGAFATSTTADTTAPSVPTGLVSGTKTLTSIALQWTASTDNVAVTGYKVFRNGTQVGTSASATYTDNGLAPGTTYSYTVAANDAAGNVSAQTATVSAATLADTAAPSIPTGLSSPTQTVNSINLSWTASSDNVSVTGYKIFRNGTQVGTSATTTYTDTGLTAGVSYSYTVSAFDSAGNNSAQTAASSFTALFVAGDANNDGHVNFLDLSIMASTWQGTTDLRADFNHDGIVNFLDLSIMASHWGT